MFRTQAGISTTTKKNFQSHTTINRPAFTSKHRPSKMSSKVTSLANSTAGKSAIPAGKRAPSSKPKDLPAPSTKPDPNETDDEDAEEEEDEEEQRANRREELLTNSMNDPIFQIRSKADHQYVMSDLKGRCLVEGGWFFTFSGKQTDGTMLILYAIGKRVSMASVEKYQRQQEAKDFAQKMEAYIRRTRGSVPKAGTAPTKGGKGNKGRASGGAPRKN